MILPSNVSACNFARMRFRKGISSYPCLLLNLVLSWGKALTLLTILLLVGGCAHSPEDELHGGSFTKVFTPQPPTFLSGAMSVLLTNSTGFTARVAAENEPLGGTEPARSGQLLCRGSKLFFAPDPDKQAEKQFGAGGFSFVWDAAENHGFVLSEALQGYAPVAPNVHPTNLVVGNVPSTPAATVAGHACQVADATVQMSDGSTSIFRLFRAGDLNGFPVRVIAGTSPVPLTLTFSKIKLQPPPADLFVVPEGFVKYDNPEVLADEIAIRRHHLKNKIPLEPVPDQSTPQAQRRY
jgi:hypothetical protein